MINIKEVVTLPNRIFLGLLFGGLLIVFLPYKIAEKLYIVQLREDYGFIIGISILVISSILFVNLL